jgi:catechol 2,3-dioxygenase-like lactoylglutathione lyase family enzyme
MIDHAGLRVSDIAKAKEFYSKALAPIGYKMIAEYPEYKIAGFGEPPKSDLWLSSGEGVEDTNHVAFVAKDKAAVDGFHKAGISAGGTDNGAPGYRKDYSPGYYAAFVKDPDGHNIEVVFHDPNPSA